MSAVIKSNQPVLSRYLRNAMLQAMTVIPGFKLWAVAKVHLSHDPSFAPTQDSTAASLATNEANFSGYAAATAVPVVPVNLDTQTAGLIFSVVFEATTATPFVSDNITGYWTDDGTNMITAEATNVGAPVGIGLAGDYVQVDGIVPLQYRQLV